MHLRLRYSNDMRKILFVTSLVFFGYTDTDAQTNQLNCNAATKLSIQAYSAFRQAQTGYESMVSDDGWAIEWSDCRALQTTQHLRRQTQLLALINKLREQYRIFIGSWGDLQGVLAGGGTASGHAVPRTYPRIEEMLQDLAQMGTSQISKKITSSSKIAYSEALNSDQFTQLRSYKLLNGKKISSDPYYLSVLSNYQKAWYDILNTLGSSPNVFNSIAIGPALEMMIRPN